MSHVLTGTAADAPTAAPSVRGRNPHITAVLQLARFEARELLLQIPVLVFFALYLAYTGWTLARRTGDFPVLHEVDRATQTGPLFLCIALLVCVNRATLRSRQHGTDRHFDVLVMPPWRRTLAHMLSVVPFAVVTAVVVLGQVYWAGAQPGHVGHPSPAELAVGPLSVLLAGAFGVLLARLVPTVFAAPLFVVGAFFVSTMALAITGGQPWLAWLAPVVTEEGADPLPSDLLGRPAAWHALYLTGLVVLLLGVAVLRSGGRAVLVKGVTALALVATVGGAVGQSTGDSAALVTAREVATRTPEKVQICVTRGATEYCAFPEWETRVNDWDEVVGQVRSLAGGPAAGAPLTVRQRVNAEAGLTTDSAIDASDVAGRVSAGTRWGGPRVPEFAVAVASVLVAGNEKAGSSMCDGRMVTTMWLALGAGPTPMTALREVRLSDSISGSDTVLTPTELLSMTAEQTRIVRELLNRPRYSVIARVKAHWRELTMPGVSTARVAQILDVRAAAPGTVDEDDSCEE